MNSSIFNENNLNKFTNFIEKQKENKNGIKNRNIYLDALFLIISWSLNLIHKLGMRITPF